MPDIMLDKDTYINYAWLRYINCIKSD